MTTRADWQFLPTETLAKQKRDEDAAAWATQQRKVTAQSWADAHISDFAANLPQPTIPDGPFRDPQMQAAQEPPGDLSEWQGDISAGQPDTAGRIEDFGQFQGQAEQGTGGTPLEYFPEDTSRAPVLENPAPALLPSSMDEAGKRAVDSGTGQAPDVPPLPPMMAGPLRGFPYLPGKDTQPPEDTQDKIVTGKPLEGLDFTGALMKAGQNQGTSPAYAEGLPGVKLGRDPDALVKADLKGEGFGGGRPGGDFGGRIAAATGDAVGDAGTGLGSAVEAAGPASRKANAALERMAGTVDQAEQLRPEEAHQAGNINLAAFPEDVREAVERTMRDPANNQMAGQRQGVLPDAEANLRAAAVSAGTTVEDWMKSRPGRAFNEAEITALGNAITDTRRELNALKAQRAEGEAKGISDINLDAKIAERALENAALIGVFSGASSEAGRTLRALQRALTGTEGSTMRSPAIQKAFRLLGGQEKFKEWAEAFSKLPDDDLVGQYKAVQSLVKPTKMDQFLALAAGNIFGVRSVLANVLGGAIETANRPLTNLVGGDPKAAAVDVVAMGKAFGAALGNAKEALLTGTQTTRAMEAMAGGKFDNIRPEAFPGKKGLALTPSLRAMGATDEFVRTINQAGGMAVAALDEARKTGKTMAEVLEAAPEHILEAGLKAGAYATFGDKGSPVAELILGARAMAHDPDTARRVVGLMTHVLAPVVRIPDVILTRGSRLAVEPAMPLVRGIVRGVKRENPLPTREERGRAVVASAVLYGAWSFAVSGQITGDGPKDPSKKRVWLEAGNQPHSIKMGDRWFDYTNLGPAAVPFALMASAIEAYEDEGRKVAPEQAKEILDRTGKVLLDSSYVRTIGDVFKAIGEGRAADIPATVAGSALSRAVPSYLSDVARTADPESKDTKGNPLGPMVARIPGASESLPERIGPLGDPVKRPQDAVSLLSPLRSESPRDDKTAKVLADLRIGIGNPPAEVKGVHLTDQDKRKYAIESGKRIREGVDRAAASPRWSGLSDQAKRDVIKRVIDGSHEAAGVEVLRGLGRDEMRKRQDEKQAALAR